MSDSLNSGVVAMKLGSSGFSMEGGKAFSFLMSGDFEGLAALLAKDDKVAQTVDSAGKGLLHEAAKRGDAKFVRLLLDSHVPVDLVDDMGLTALHCANSDEIVTMLVDAGLDIQAKDREGDSPLHNACTMGRVGGASGMIKAKADPNATNGEGQTPLHLLFSECSNAKDMIEIMTVLIKAGANPEQKDDNEVKPIDLIKKQAVLKALLELVPKLKATVVTAETNIADLVKGSRFAKYNAMLEGEDLIQLQDLEELDDAGWAALKSKGLTIGAISFFKKELAKIRNK